MGDPLKDDERSVYGVVGESGPFLGEDFHPKKEENLLEGEFFRLLGEIVCEDPLLAKLLSEMDRGRPC